MDVMCRALVGSGSLSLLERLLDSHPEIVESTDESGNTLLHSACCQGAMEVARFLLERGLSLASLNASGRTPLDLAPPEMLSALGQTPSLDLIPVDGELEPAVDQNQLELLTLPDDVAVNIVIALGDDTSLLKQVVRHQKIKCHLTPRLL